ncbi:MAG: magnesium and cobalt exporter, family [Solirubrobacteraceae bacterium]|nr:magnesium and cobalt exporter, family [Solirubrobacteraceae bacterium]
MSDVLRVLVVLALIAGNAFYVVAEYAVETARRSGLAPLAERGSRRAAAALRLMDDPVRVISTVQVGITAIGILTGAVAEPLVGELVGDGIPKPIGFVLSFGVVTYLSVVLGELVPKALALDRAETLAMLVAPPVHMLQAALRPVVWVLQQSARVCLRPFGIRDVVAGESIRSADELRALVDEAESAGVIPQAQEEMLHNVFDFAHQEARDVMVPSPDVAWLDAALSPDAAVGRALETAHARFPVGRGTLDRLVGVVHLRELVDAARAGAPPTIEPLARAALIVPETKDVGALLRELRDRRQTLAVVVDEYGATSGIVTMEDIVEEIVGEIQDEFDLPDDTVTRLDERTVEAAGSMTIDDFNEAIGTDLPQDGPRTLAGLVFDRLGRRPAVGDEIAVEGVRLRVTTVEGARITRLTITLPEALADRRPPAGEAGDPLE